MKKLLFLITLSSFIACKPQIEEKKRTVLDANLDDKTITHLTDVDDNYTTLNDIIAQNKGKVVYVDIWASWCGPCKAQMPASEKLQEQFKGKDVTFIYISVDQNADAWSKSAQAFKLNKEKSFLARNYPAGSFYQNNNVSNVPRYFLYDKSGRMIDDDAMRPSEPDLANTIDALLKM